jgi:hypothetical protein
MMVPIRIKTTVANPLEAFGGSGEGDTVELSPHAYLRVDQVQNLRAGDTSGEVQYVLELAPSIPRDLVGAIVIEVARKLSNRATNTVAEMWIGRKRVSLSEAAISKELRGYVIRRWEIQRVDKA